MTYRQAFAIWRQANPHSPVLPDHARTTLVDGVWRMHSANRNGIPLGRIDDMTGRFMKEGN